VSKRAIIILSCVAASWIASAMTVGVLAGCFTLPGFSPSIDARTADDIDGDGIVNELDDDMDGDGLPNAVDPDADSDGRLDKSVVVDFPFDHNALIKPLLPPNHPKFDFQGTLVIPKGHIDISDIIHANLETHPLDFLAPDEEPSARAVDDESPDSH